MTNEVFESFTELVQEVESELARASEQGPEVCKPYIDSLWRILASMCSLHSQLSPNKPVSESEQRAIEHLQGVLAPYLDWYTQETGEGRTQFPNRAA